MVQAVGSWSMEACCAVGGNVVAGTHGNKCLPNGRNTGYCSDHTSSSDWLFGLWPGPPQRFQPTGTGSYAARTRYQAVSLGWPLWGNGDLRIGDTSGAPGLSLIHI